MHTTIYTTFVTILYYFTIHNKQDLRYNTTNSHSLTYTHEQVYIAKSHLFEPDIFNYFLYLYCPLVPKHI